MDGNVCTAKLAIPARLFPPPLVRLYTEEGSLLGLWQ